MRVACTQRGRTLACQGACALGTRELRSGPSISSEEPASWGGSQRSAGGGGHPAPHDEAVPSVLCLLLTGPEPRWGQQPLSFLLLALTACLRGSLTPGSCSCHPQPRSACRQSPQAPPREPPPRRHPDPPSNTPPCSTATNRPPLRVPQHRKLIKP